MSSVMELYTVAVNIRINNHVLIICRDNITGRLVTFAKSYYRPVILDLFNFGRKYRTKFEHHNDQN